MSISYLNCKTSLSEKLKLTIWAVPMTSCSQEAKQHLGDSILNFYLELCKHSFYLATSLSPSISITIKDGKCLIVQMYIVTKYGAVMCIAVLSSDNWRGPEGGISRFQSHLVPACFLYCSAGVVQCLLHCAPELT